MLRIRILMSSTVLELVLHRLACASCSMPMSVCPREAIAKVEYEHRVPSLWNR